MFTWGDFIGIAVASGVGYFCGYQDSKNKMTKELADQRRDEEIMFLRQQIAEMKRKQISEISSS